MGAGSFVGEAASPFTLRPNWMMASAGAIADSLIALAHRRGRPVNNLKLQRLLYYAQAWHLGRFGCPLFPEKLEAWMTGPVIPSLYWKFKPHGIGDLPVPPAVPELSPALAAFLDEIAADYLPLDEYDLDDMSKRETPWRAARGGLDPSEPSRNELSEDEMRAFFHALAAAA
jgi:uncharacterized phage-associated protein